MEKTAFDFLDVKISSLFLLYFFERFPKNVIFLVLNIFLYILK